MHVALCNFASAIDQRFPDLRVLRGADEDLILEWQEAPGALRHTVTARMSGEGFIVFEYCGGIVRAVADPPIASAVAALSRERGSSAQANIPILAAPGTFAALVLERHLLRDSTIRPQSPDRLN